ncbi:hypothetical protein CTA2_5263 [Colletotrichum tanaceti]|uniref:Clr5 domain-containing protein n=1 Tax=Colletotrichum tanaceti TaxID=1306861 RepID=A0A4U6XRH7_9PEZI|nr:hypothetical protein CTA2_5263 [Colletotrichum tanaceti]TKW58418.1 hypothetical protein CTA1_9138 [Colletotrichum tanaceti]
MVGQISYTEEQIIFVLQQLLAGEKRDIILQEYKRKFNKALSTAQLRYIKIKYGHDPEFGQHRNDQPQAPKEWWKQEDSEGTIK